MVPSFLSYELDEAWFNTVTKLLEEKKITADYLDKAIQSSLSNSKDFFENIKKIFIANQMAQKIMEAIFKNVPADANLIKSYAIKIVINKIKQLLKRTDYFIIYFPC